MCSSDLAKEQLNEKGKSEIRSTRLSNPPKITILKREKKQWTKLSSAPTMILPERVDKPNLAESPKGKMILPEKVDTSKASPRTWMNTVDPWTSQWVKKVVNVMTNPKGVRRSFKVSTKGTLLGGGTQSLPDNWWYKGQRGQGQHGVVPARHHSISGRRLPC